MMKKTMLCSLVLIGALALAAGEILFADGSGGKVRTAKAGEFENRKVLLPAMDGWGLDLAPNSTDWSDFDAVELEIYSGRAGKDTFMVTMDSPRADTPDGRGYFNCKLPVDWTGWKKVTLPFSGFTRSRNPAGWDKITEFHMTPKGYGITPVPGAEIYIAAIRLRPGQAPVAAAVPAPAPASVAAAAPPPAKTDRPDILFADGKSGGEWKIAKVVEFEGKPVLEPALTGWGASVVPANRDWSNYDALVFEMYSERANKENFVITAAPTPPAKAAITT